MRDGSQPASPGYLRHAVSQLATTLRELGVPKHANPVYAVSVVKYMGGYKRALVELGYVESGAVPLDYATLAELVQFMDGLILRTAADLVIIAAVHRDVCIVLYLCETAARGFEVGTMELTDFLVRGVDLRPAWDAIVAGRLTVDDRVLAEPRYGTKGDLTAHSGVMELELLPPGNALAISDRPAGAGTALHVGPVAVRFAADDWLEQVVLVPGFLLGVATWLGAPPGAARGGAGSVALVNRGVCVMIWTMRAALVVSDSLIWVRPIRRRGVPIELEFLGNPIESSI
eukprot:jgi/Tetstr1/441980/TSEL_030185.t1